MWRLDTALNWKNWVLYWHKKITYEVPCTDCPNPHDCPTWWEWDPIEEECIPPTCLPEDPGYDCDCRCEEWQECVNWECINVETPCWTCYKLVDWVCVRDYDECPDDPPEPPEPGDCPKCYTYDSSTGKCKFNPDECPEPPVCEDPCVWNDDIQKCVCPPIEIPIPPCDPDDPDCPTHIPLPIDDCFDFVKVWDWWMVNADGKTTWRPWSTKRNWLRYWFSTMCYSRVEFFARITTVWEGVNKSGIEHWYAETKWNLTYVASAYYWDYVQMHHDDVLKVILYADWREETYIKSFIRPWVWSWWEVYSNIKRPETPPSWEINWIVVWVLWWAEIWDMKWYKEENVISEDDAIIEVTPQNIAGCISYDLKWCKWNVCWYEKAFWTVRDSDNHLWQTMYFWWKNPFRWANWETKRNYVTYRDWVLTIPRGSLFRYVWPRMNQPTEGVSWRTDMKFTVNCPSDYGTWKIFLWFWVCDENGENPMQRRRVEAYASDFINRDLWLTYETAYTCSYPEYVEDLMLYYWTWTWQYRWYDMIWSSYNFINHDQRWPYYYYMDIQIQDNCNIDSIDISYMSEWQGSYYIRY